MPIVHPMNTNIFDQNKTLNTISVIESLFKTKKIPIIMCPIIFLSSSFSSSLEIFLHYIMCKYRAKKKRPCGPFGLLMGSRTFPRLFIISYIPFDIRLEFPTETISVAILAIRTSAYRSSSYNITKSFHINYLL